MPLNSLASEILSIPGVPDGGARVEAIVADTLSFVPSQTFAAPTVTLARKPAASTATVAANAVTVDLAGLLPRHRIGRWLPSHDRGNRLPSVGAHAEGRACEPAQRERHALRTFAGSPWISMVSLATMSNSLEAATPTLIGITGGSSGPVWTQYGNA